MQVADASDFPEPRQILGMLAMDRDVDDFLDYARGGDAIGAYYRDQARISLVMRKLRARYEAVFAAAARSATVSTSGDAGGRQPPYIASSEEIRLPPVGDLKYSHPYALDVFFKNVRSSGEAESGPLIHALYPGIVVASASDWSGGQGPSSWKSGGLSPAAGNGVVIYDPGTRVLCSYFHLSAVALRTGSVVRAGETIGRGGNSGVNARKKGHGGHVHIEIFDAARNAALSSYEIRSLLASPLCKPL